MIDDALEVMDELAPTLAFLAALLVLAEGCRSAGLFAAAGHWLGEARAGTPRALQRRVFVLACAVTAVLSLDATVLLLTPVVLTAVRRARVDAERPLLATVHLANSASLLLPISNLTNLLAFRASELSFARFTLWMTLPWLVAIAIEWLTLRPRTPGPGPGPLPNSHFGEGPGPVPNTHFGEGPGPVPNTHFGEGPGPVPNPGFGEGPGPSPEVARFAVGAVAVTLAALVAASAAGVEPALVAAAGALVLAGHERMAPRDVVRAAKPGFLAIVLVLGVAIDLAVPTGPLQDLLPAGESLGALLAVAAIAAVLANVVNNLPATLLLVPLVAPIGPAAVLAALIGVNAGPNLTPHGSLATVLWRRVLDEHDADVSRQAFFRAGLVATPAVLVLSTTALWLAVQATP